MAKKKEEEVSPESVLDVTLANIRKEFGTGAVMTGNTDYASLDIDWIPSGAPSLDYALGGGYARGRIIEFLGKESAGKTTLTLHAIHQAQKLGLKAAFIDAEHALDPVYASGIGVDMEQLIIAQPNCGEEALEIAKLLTKSGTVALIVIDSVAALTPRAELEGEIGQSHVGLQARLMSQAMRMLTGSCQKTNTTIIFINQIRMKVGIIWGSPEVGAGGEALKYYSSQRLDIRRSGTIGKGDEAEAITSRIKVIKNKVGRPFRQTELDIYFGKGVSWETDLLRLSVEHNIVEKAGAWYKYNGEQVGQGEKNSVQTLIERPEMTQEIYQKVKEAMK